MAGMQNFRSALGGFNRQDVVNYIEYMNNKHNSELEQLNTQLQNAKEALAQAEAEDNSELQAKLEAAVARCAELEAQLAEAGNAAGIKPGDELEAYRRAERTERMARERAEQMYRQATGVIADATTRVDETAGQIGEMTDRVLKQLLELQNAVSGSKQALQDAAATLYAIRPETEE